MLWRSRGHKSKNKGLIKTNICIVILANSIPTIAFIFSFCVVILCVFTFWVPCWDVRYDFRIKTMFKSSLFPVVCMRAHVLFTLFLFVCVVLSNTYCAVFLICFLFFWCGGPILPVALDCPFLIAPSVFFNVYLSVDY